MRIFLFTAFVTYCLARSIFDVPLEQPFQQTPEDAKLEELERFLDEYENPSVVRHRWEA